MGTIKVMLFVVSLSISYSAVESLNCQNGTQVEAFATLIDNTFELVTCPADVPHSCVRFEVEAEQIGFSTVTTLGRCLPTSGCSSLSCDAVEEGVTEAGQTFVSCAFGCCDTDNCNNAAVSTFPPMSTRTSSMVTSPPPSPPIPPSPPSRSPPPMETAPPVLPPTEATQPILPSVETPEPSLPPMETPRPVQPPEETPPPPPQMPETVAPPETTTAGGGDGVSTTSGSPKVMASSLWLLFTTLSLTVSSFTLSLM